MTRIGIGCVAAAALLGGAGAGEPGGNAGGHAGDRQEHRRHHQPRSAEVFELGGEMINQLYDRIMAYEAEDDQAGRRRRRELQRQRRRPTITLKIRPGLAFHFGNPVRAEDVAFSLQRVIKLNLTPAFILTSSAGAPTTSRHGQGGRRPDGRASRSARLAPSFVLNCLSAGVGSVVDRSWCWRTPPATISATNG